MSAHKDFAKANEAYVATFGDKGNLPLPPAKKLLIGASRSSLLSRQTDVLTPPASSHLHGRADQVRPPGLFVFTPRVRCSLETSARSVYAELGIQEGEAHIVRNAGGVA